MTSDAAFLVSLSPSPLVIDACNLEARLLDAAPISYSAMETHPVDAASMLRAPPQSSSQSADGSWQVDASAATQNSLPSNALMPPVPVYQPPSVSDDATASSVSLPMPATGAAKEGDAEGSSSSIGGVHGLHPQPQPQPYGTYAQQQPYNPYAPPQPAQPPDPNAPNMMELVNKASLEAEHPVACCSGRSVQGGLREPNNPSVQLCCCGESNGNTLAFYRRHAGAELFPRTMVIGPDWPCLCITFFLVLAPTVAFLVLV